MTDTQSDLRKFLDAAAGEGLELAGVDAAKLFMRLFPGTPPGRDILADISYYTAARDAEIAALTSEVARLRDACSEMNEEISQTLGRALGYPRICDDQKNFPGATDADGVCVGEHIAETLAEEAAKAIARLRADAAVAKQVFDYLDEGEGNAPGHCHEVPGVWDGDNGKLAGKPCEWCATWRRFHTALATSGAGDTK